MRIVDENHLACFIITTLLFSFSHAGSIYEESDIEDELIDIEESIDRFDYFGDLQLRSDSVRDLPRPVEKDFDRVTARARLGLLWFPTDSLEVGLTGKINFSTQSNSETRFNLDNERADDISLDELFFNYQFTEHTLVQVGQTHFPLLLSPMVWDQDLRPQGVSVSHRYNVGEFNSVDLMAGIFLGNHLFGDSSNIKAVQAALNIGEGKNTSYNIIFSYLDFNNLDDLAANSLLRTNLASANGNYANDFNTADIQVNLNLNQHSFR